MRNSDVRKFNDVYRQVLAGNAAQREALTAWLEARFARRELAYGLHVTDRAHMTCLVFDYSGRHLHFIDGADGGLFAASKEFKRARGAARMIAIDWGTTSFRAYRLDRQGNVVDARSSGKGIMATPPGPRCARGRNRRLARRWPDRDERDGWQPAGLGRSALRPMSGRVPEIASALKPVSWGKRKAWIVPGVSCRDAAGVPDVMRGEETQILGCAVDGTICLPGTHSKWVEVRGGRIERFSTAMTGEVYAVLKQHSILGRMMEEGAADAEAFAQGVRRSGDEGGLLHHLFGVRTRGLMGELHAGGLGVLSLRHPHRTRAARPRDQGGAAPWRAGADHPLRPGSGAARRRRRARSTPTPRCVACSGSAGNCHAQPEERGARGDEQARAVVLAPGEVRGAAGNADHAEAAAPRRRTRGCRPARSSTGAFAVDLHAVRRAGALAARPRPRRGPWRACRRPARRTRGCACAPCR